MSEEILNKLRDRLKHLQREAYLLARSDMAEGDHPSGIDILNPTFNAIDSMLGEAWWGCAEQYESAKQERKYDE